MWALGLGINFVFSFMAACGLNLQKRSLDMHVNDGVPPHRQGLWLCGFGVMVLGSVSDFIAFGLAPMSLLAPLASLTLVWNLLLATRMHGERLDRANIIATTVIFIGVSVAVVFSSHETPLYTAEKLASLVFAPAAVVYLLVNILVMIVAAYVLWKWKHVKLHAKVFAYGILAGSLGGQSVMFAKATVELLKAVLVGAASFASPVLWLMAVATIVLMMVQLRILNQGLEEFPALAMIPVYQACWILASTLSGLIYFNEWATFTVYQKFFFLLGTGVTLLGILILLKSRPAAEEDDTPKGVIAESSSPGQQRDDVGLLASEIELVDGSLVVEPARDGGYSSSTSTDKDDAHLLGGKKHTSVSREERGYTPNSGPIRVDQVRPAMVDSPIRRQPGPASSPPPESSGSRSRAASGPMRGSFEEGDLGAGGHDDDTFEFDFEAETPGNSSSIFSPLANSSRQTR
jgi:hypothetical protein